MQGQIIIVSLHYVFFFLLHLYIYFLAIKMLIALLTRRCTVVVWVLIRIYCFILEVFFSCVFRYSLIFFHLMWFFFAFNASSVFTSTRVVPVAKVLVAGISKRLFGVVHASFSLFFMVVSCCVTLICQDIMFSDSTITKRIGWRRGCMVPVCAGEVARLHCSIGNEKQCVCVCDARFKEKDYLLRI